jgi:hypothetical protein
MVETESGKCEECTDLRGPWRTGRTLRARRTLGPRSGATKVLRTIWVLARSHSHIMRRRRSRAVGSANARVVLGTTPAQADTRVPDRIALHLVDGHLSGVAVDKLDEPATLARRNLDVGYLTESLKEAPKLVLGNITRKTTDKDSRVIGIRELIHLSRRVIAAVGRRVTGRRTAKLHLLLRSEHVGTHHLLLLILTRIGMRSGKHQVSFDYCKSKIKGIPK